MKPIRPLLVLALLLAAACGDAEEAREQAPVVAASAPDAVVRMEIEAQAPQAPQPPGTTVQPRADSPTVVPSMIVRTGTATVEVDELDPAVARVRALAERLGGYVANTRISGGEERAREAVLELKVPAARFDEALGGLAPLGEVESVEVTAEDVGEEYVDVSARLANARRLEERLLGLLETRTGELEEVLAVERELARVRGEIERHEGRLRYLRTRAAVSTLTVRLHEPYAVVGDYPGANPIAEAFAQAWRNFVAFLALFIASLGILVPLGVIALLVWLAVRRLRRRRAG